MYISFCKPILIIPIKISMGKLHISEKAMATHSSTLAWKIPWTEEPGGLQSMGSLRVRHDWVTSLSLFTFLHWRRKWQSTNPLQCFCLKNPKDRGAWWVSIYGVAQSRAWLKQLSSSGNDPKINLGLLTGIWAVRGNWLGNEGSKNCDLSLRFTRTYKQIRH